MALAQVHGVVVSGVTGAMVRVEVEVSQGLPSVGVVGLPDTSVTEARWRARSAIASIGASWPDKRVTIGLSPAEVRKNGAGLDLPIALGVLSASDQLPGVDLSSTTFVGELGLDGTLRPTRGALAGALAARRAGIERLVAPPQSAREMARLPGLRVVVAETLGQVVAVLRGDDAGMIAAIGSEPDDQPGLDERSVPDLRDVRGQAQARYGIEVAAAGAHNISLIGVPGVGKTLLAERLPGLLPDLDDEAAIEVAAIHSVAGLARSPSRFGRPPYRCPHHSSSGAALLGSVQGHRVMPGAVTLSHRGVLFLDEAPEFAATAPARRWRCGATRRACWVRSWTGSTFGCRCRDLLRRSSGIRRTRSRRVAAREGRGGSRAGGAEVRRPARTSNARIPAGELRRTWGPDAGEWSCSTSLERRSANLRGPDRVLRIAWSIADLGGRGRPGRDDVAGALTLRGATAPFAR